MGRAYGLEFSYKNLYRESRARQTGQTKIQSKHSHTAPSKDPRLKTCPHISVLLPPPQKKTTPSPPKLLLLQSPKEGKTDRAKRKRQLEADVAAVLRVANLAADGADEPDLRHAHDGAKGAEAEGEDGGDAGREEARVVPDGDVVLAALEDEVLG